MAPVRCSDMPSGTLRDRETLTDINRSLEQNPDNAKALAHRGENHRLTGNFETALDDFNRSIELEPDYAWAIAHRGETYRLMERYEEALADFNRAIELNPDYNWAIAHRGVTYERIERFEEAVTDLSQAIKINPTYAWAFAYRCRAYEMLRHYEEALIDFDRAIALDQTIINDWLTERGLLLSLLGRYPDAMKYYERALQEKPDDHFTLYCIAFTKTRWQGLAQTQAEIDKARSVLHSRLISREANRNVQARSALLYELGGLAALEGKTDQALKYLQQAMLLDYLPVRRARHDLAWLDLYSDSGFKALISETP